MKARIFGTTSLLLFLALAAWAGEEPVAVEDFVFAADYYKEYLDTTPGMVAMSGRIHLARGDFELKVPDGGVVLWVDPDGWRALRGSLLRGDGTERPTPEGALGTVIHEIYAEGNATLRRDREQVRAERIYYDFKKNHAVLINGEAIYRYESKDGALKVPIIIRADRIRRLGEERVEAGPARFTTCDFGEPHYEFSVDRIVLTGKDGQYSASSEGNVLRTMDAPVLWLPWLSAGTGYGAEPLKGIDVGVSSAYGFYVDVMLGGAFRLGKDPEAEPIGEWWVNPVYRHRRGPGIGAGIEYDQPDARGRIEGFHQRDSANRDKSTDTEVPRRDRGRARLMHRHVLDRDFLGGELLGIAEVAYISDRDFLVEYFDQEALEEKAQETMGYLSLAGAEHAATLTSRWRINNFETITEYLPRVDYGLFTLPAMTDIVGSGADLLLSGEAGAARVYRQYDEDLPDRGQMTDRYFARASATMPFSVGPVRIRPELGGGTSAYRDGQQEDRMDSFTSIRAATDFRRLYPDVTSESFDLTGLNHVIDLSLAWVDRFKVTTGSDDLVVQDPLDFLDEIQAFDFRWRNRLQTKRDGKVVDWIDLELRTIFFPEEYAARPSPFGAREEWGQGLSSLLLTGEETWRSIDRKGFGPLTGDLRVLLRDDLVLTASAWYDFETDKFETYSEGIRYEARPDLAFFLGHRAIAGDSSVLSAWAEIRVTDGWDIRFLQQTDFRNDGALISGLSVRKLMHDFMFEVTIENDFNRNDFSVRFSFEPRVLYEALRQRESDEPLSIYSLR
jgi:hypothetical protein